MESTDGQLLWVWELLWIYPVIIYWRKLIFLFDSKYQLRLCVRKYQITFVMGGMWCLLPLLVSRILSGLSLCRTCTRYQGLCEFVCVSVLLSLEYTASLEPSTISRSHNLPVSFSTEIHESWEYGFDEDIVFRIIIFNISYSLHIDKFPDLPKHDQYFMYQYIVGPSVQIQEPFEEISHKDQKRAKQRPYVLC